MKTSPNQTITITKIEDFYQIKFLNRKSADAEVCWQNNILETQTAI